MELYRNILPKTNIITPQPRQSISAKEKSENFEFSNHITRYLNFIQHHGHSDEIFLDGNMELEFDAKGKKGWCANNEHSNPLLPPHKVTGEEGGSLLSV
jgi:hypothetical protein